MLLPLQQNYKWKISDICYAQVQKPGENMEHTNTSGVIKDGRSKILIIIIAVFMILSATSAGTVYTLLQLSRLKSEIISSNIASAASLQLRDNNITKRFP